MKPYGQNKTKSKICRCCGRDRFVKARETEEARKIAIEQIEEYEEEMAELFYEASKDRGW